MEEKYLKSIAVVVRDSIKARIKNNDVTPKTDKPGTTLVKSSRLMRSIKEQIIGSDSIAIGTNLAYAQIQNDGGETHPTVTPKLRGFAWAMYYKAGGGESENETEEQLKWKAIALTIKNELTVKIPARPYMFIDDSTQTRIEGICRLASEKLAIEEVSLGIQKRS